MRVIMNEVRPLVYDDLCACWIASAIPPSIAGDAKWLLCRFHRAQLKAIHIEEQR
jgi:hypothetical protein